MNQEDCRQARTMFRTWCGHASGAYRRQQTDSHSSAYNLVTHTPPVLTLVCVSAPHTFIYVYTTHRWPGHINPHLCLHLCMHISHIHTHLHLCVYIHVTWSHTQAYAHIFVSTCFSHTAYEQTKYRHTHFFKKLWKKDHIISSIISTAAHSLCVEEFCLT